MRLPNRGSDGYLAITGLIRNSSVRTTASSTRLMWAKDLGFQTVFAGVGFYVSVFRQHLKCMLHAEMNRVNGIRGRKEVRSRRLSAAW